MAKRLTILYLSERFAERATVLDISRWEDHVEWCLSKCTKEAKVSWVLRRMPVGMIFAEVEGMTFRVRQKFKKEIRYLFGGHMTALSCAESPW